MEGFTNEANVAMISKVVFEQAGLQVASCHWTNQQSDSRGLGETGYSSI